MKKKVRGSCIIGRNSGALSPPTRGLSPQRRRYKAGQTRAGGRLAAKRNSCIPEQVSFFFFSPCGGGENLPRQLLLLLLDPHTFMTFRKLYSRFRATLGVLRLPSGNFVAFTLSLDELFRGAIF